MGDEGAGSIAWTSVVKAAVGRGDFGAHLPGIIPVELSAWKKQAISFQFNLVYLQYIPPFTIKLSLGSLHGQKLGA